MQAPTQLLLMNHLLNNYNLLLQIWPAHKKSIPLGGLDSIGLRNAPENWSREEQ